MTGHDKGPVLGFDTSAAHCAAAVVSGDRVLALRQEDRATGQAERLMPMLAEVLEEAGLGLTDLAAIGVGTGPGNFTGIRISVAAARGLALATGLPAIGVTALESLAEDIDAPILALRDARRGQVYLQRFGPGAEGPILAPIDGAEAMRLATGAVLVGDHAEALAEASGARTAVPAHPLPVAIARIAARRIGTGQPRPAPLYLRPADAAPARDGGPVLLP